MGAVLQGAGRTPQAALWLKPAQYVYMYSQAGVRHVTAANGLKSLRPCSLSDVTVEGSRLSVSFRRFRLRIWSWRSRMASFVLVSIKPTEAVTVWNSAAPSTASAQPALCAETHQSGKRTRQRMKNSTTTMAMTWSRWTGRGRRWPAGWLLFNAEPGWKLGNSCSWNCSFCNNVGLRML